MLVWQGFGILALFIPVLCYVAFVKIFQQLLGIAYTDTHSWPGALGTLAGAGLIWLMARKLDTPGRTLIDPASGKTVILKKKHTLFYIPILYVAYIMVVVAVGILVFKSGSPL